MRTKLKVLACVTGIAAPWLLAAGSAGAGSPSEETYTLSHVISLPDGQQLRSFDISFVSVANGTYTLAASALNATGLGPAAAPAIVVVDTNFDVVVNEVGKTVLSGACSIAPARDDYSGPNGEMVVEKGANADIWAGNGPIYTPSCAFPGSATPGTLTTPSNVKVFDLRTGALKGSISTGGKARADEMCYNPSSDTVLVANDDPSDNFITFIGEDSFRVLGKIRFDGTDANGDNILANGIEQCAFNPRDGKFYINIPMTGPATCTATSSPPCGPGHTLRISAQAPFHVEADFTIAISTGCVGPQGLSVGPDHQLALGCGGANSLVIDDQTGATVATVAGGGGTDEDWYNPGSNHYYFAQSTLGTLTVEDAGPPASKDPTVSTVVGSHSVAADPIGNRVYVPIRGSGFGSPSANVCSSGTDVFGNKGNDANGCIAVYTAPSDSDDCLPKGTPVVAVDPDGNPNFLKVSCKGNGRHDRDDH
jgi:hypothetical protein